MGAACWNRERHAEAAVNAKKALVLDPALKEARFNLAFALLMTGRRKEAKTILEALLQRILRLPGGSISIMRCICLSEENLRRLKAYSTSSDALPIGRVYRRVIPGYRQAVSISFA
ncbi:MAG: tetratricopeptide repeat protein [Desulfobacterales bacterium]|nr:tetratricopeptide repeat protein [Desulfobacterales bacterium]